MAPAQFEAYLRPCETRENSLAMGLRAAEGYKCSKREKGRGYTT